MTGGAIDIVVNLRDARVIASGQVPTDAAFQAQTRQDATTRAGIELDDYVRMMDAAGIERSFLIAVRCGPYNYSTSTAIPYEWVADAVAAYPDRFSGIAGIDPSRGMAQLAELEHAVRNLGFIGAHWYPHWFAMPPDAPQIYPIYAKCCELDVPLMLQVGQNLIYRSDVRLPSVARPILLDQVAIDFPDLKLVGIHLGTPWADEMIAMCWKHANVFMAGDAYAPKHWPQSFVRYADSYGQDKCLFGTDWPVIDPLRAMREVDAIGFRQQPRAKLLRENAQRIFGLPR